MRNFTEPILPLLLTFQCTWLILNANVHPRRGINIDTQSYISQTVERIGFRDATKAHAVFLGEFQFYLDNGKQHAWTFVCFRCVELLIGYQSPGQTLYKTICKQKFDFRIKKMRVRALSYTMNHKLVHYIRIVSVRLHRLIKKKIP
jgi:hypothetical protein